MVKIYNDSDSIYYVKVEDCDTLIKLNQFQMVDLQNTTVTGSLFLSVYKLYDLDKKSLIYSNYVVSDGVITLSSLLNNHPININDIETKHTIFNDQDNHMKIIIALISILLIYLLFI